MRLRAAERHAVRVPARAPEGALGEHESSRAPGRQAGVGPPPRSRATEGRANVRRASSPSASRRVDISQVLDPIAIAPIEKFSRDDSLPKIDHIPGGMHFRSVRSKPGPLEGRLMSGT
jgi:hypothetical protein